MHTPDLHHSAAALLPVYRRAQTFIEPLETRIAPAGVFTFLDVDGDLVKITSSLGTNVELAAAVTRVGGQLRSLDLTAAIFQNTNITASVITKSASGDGLVNIGRINASGRDLGTVAIAGDLGDIDCGDANPATAALRSLSVRSLGLFGLATQGGAGDLESNIAGPLGTLTVQRDIVGATIYVNAAEHGDLGSAAIGGSIIGGTAANRGQIQTTGSLGPVSIGGDLVGGTDFLTGTLYGATIANVTIGGSLIGGTGLGAGGIFSNGALGVVKIGGDMMGGLGAGSGKIVAGGKITSVNIGGSLLGGDGVAGGVVNAGLEIGAVTIGGNLKGGASGSGGIIADGKITSVTLGGSLLGGPGPNSGLIVSVSDIGPVKIGFDVKGGAGNESGKIDAGGKLTSLTIGGSLLGGSGHYDTNVVNAVTHSGQIYARSGIDAVKIGGDVLGSTGRYSAAVVAGNANDGAIKIGPVAIGGSLFGGSGSSSGLVRSAGHLGAVTVGHSIVGGEGDESGGLSANGGILSSVSIGGSLVGGQASGQLTGFLFSRGNMGAVSIKGDVLGGTGQSSGYLYTLGTLTSLSIGGSLIGSTGGASGFIRAIGAIGAVSIGHDVLGGNLTAGEPTLFGSGYLESENRIASVFVGGSIISGSDISGSGSLIKNGSIRANRDIGSFTVVGGLIGNVTPTGESPVIISAYGRTPVAGATTDLAFGKISIGGRVERAQIFAGYDTNLEPQNADAQVGPVTVGADWIASSIVAGAVNLGQDFAVGGSGANADNVNFGDLADRKISEAGELPGVFARIASITIAGQAYGTPESILPSDQFGFVAEHIGALKVGARTFTLQPGVNNDGFQIHWRLDSVADDIYLHETSLDGLGFTTTVPDSAKRVNNSTVTYLDADGDKVTVTFSQPLITSAAVANSVFRFNTGTVNDGVPALQQLQSLDLRPLASNGLGVTLTVVRGVSGDGFVHVGAIDSRGYDVGVVSIPGDLGQIDAGSGTAGRLGVGSLFVRSMGRLGVETQRPPSIVVLPDLQSDITGGLGTFAVREDFVGVFLNVNGAIGTVTIGGSMIGGAEEDSGTIVATTGIGAVKIGDHLQGGLGEDTGKIFTSTGNIASATIGGSLLGGVGEVSGRIDAGGSLGAVNIAHNLRGGTELYNGGLGAENNITSVTIGGSLLGGSGTFTAGIEAEGTIGPVKITHNLVGGSNDNAGYIWGYDLLGVSVGGSLFGGTDYRTGSIATFAGLGAADGDMTVVGIGQDVRGGSGLESGRITAEGAIGSLSIGGSLVGGGAESSGQVRSTLDLRTLRVWGNLAGGGGEGSGTVVATFGNLVTASIGGSLVAGLAESSGTLAAGTPNAGTLTVGRNLLGGGVFSGSVIVGDDLTSLTVGGSVIGGSAQGGGVISVDRNAGTIRIGGDVIGGSASYTGVVLTTGKLTSLSIGRSLIGGSASFTGAVFTDELGALGVGRNMVGGSIAGTTATVDSTGYITTAENRIGNVTIGGSVFAGWDSSSAGSLTRNASIRAGEDLGAVVIKGSLHGNATTPIVISARGQETPTATSNLAIKSLSVTGSVERAFVLAGFVPTLEVSNLRIYLNNNTAQIGAVTVGRDWSASSLVAGVSDIDNDGFGDADDGPPGNPATIARIASIVIGGVVAGSATAGDHFGFVASSIGSFKSFNFTAPLNAASNVVELSLTTGDTTLREVSSPTPT